MNAVCATEAELGRGLKQRMDGEKNERDRKSEGEPELCELITFLVKKKPKTRSS